MKTLDHTKHYVRPFMPKNGYRFVAAALSFKSNTQLSASVRYQNNTKCSMTSTSNSAWFCLPDRTITIYNNSEYDYNKADYNVNLSPFNDTVAQSMGMQYVMTNYVHDVAADIVRLNLRTDPLKRIHVMSDSGGLQISRGLVKSIDPVDLITYYNSSVDSGMVLDVPLRFKGKSDVFKSLAKHQKENTDIMLKLSKGVELINIYHGRSLKETLKYVSIVQDDRLSRIAIPTSSSISNRILDILLLVLELANQGIVYEQYHILGIYKMSIIPVLVKLANLNRLSIHVTSDSSSFFQAAMNNEYITRDSPRSPLRRIIIGSKKLESNRYGTLPCQCIICTTVKFTNLLSQGTSITRNLLALHNMQEMSRYANFLQDFLHNYPERYNLLIADILKKHESLHNVKQALEFLDFFDNHGLEKTKIRYSNQLSLGSILPRHKSTLNLGLSNTGTDGSNLLVINNFVAGLKNEKKKKSTTV